MKRKVVFKEKLYALHEVIIEGNEENIDKALESTYEGGQMDDFLLQLGYNSGIKILSHDKGDPEPDDEVEVWEDTDIE